MIDVMEFKKRGIPQKEVTLTNRNTGTVKTYTLRPFQRGDEEGIISIVRDEHGDTYFKTYFYDPVALREKAEGDEFIFFVAQRRDKIIGIEILRIYTKNDDDFIEPASQFVNRRYRGYSLAEALVTYTFEVAISMKPSALFVHAAMYHPITQHVCESYGMEPVGFEIGSFLTEVMSNTFAMKEIRKYSAGAMCYPVEKKEAGTIYVPKEWQAYCCRVYDNLKVDVKMHSDMDAVDIPDTSEIVVTDVNDMNRYIAIQVVRSGRDLAQRIRELMLEHTDGVHNPDAWTYLVIIDIDSPEFLPLYESLKDMGFFFGGLQPLCGPHERAFLYWVGDLELQMEKYVVTEKFAIIRDSIMHFYRKRIH